MLPDKLEVELLYEDLVNSYGWFNDVDGKENYCENCLVATATNRVLEDMGHDGWFAQISGTRWVCIYDHKRSVWYGIDSVGATFVSRFDRLTDCGEVFEEKRVDVPTEEYLWERHGWQFPATITLSQEVL
jgi:hypothetical protein